MLKNEKLLKTVGGLTVGLLGSVAAFWSLSGTMWSRFDFQVLDFFYQQAVKSSSWRASSSQVVLLTITDSTYHHFGKNILDRADLAKINQALSELGVETVVYDILFSRPSDPAADSAFAESIAKLGRVYLPIGFGLSDRALPFQWKIGSAYKRLQTDFIRKPAEKGTSKPIYAKYADMQLESLFTAAHNSGDISALSDPDGVYRHTALLVKVDSLCFPTLALAMLLDYANPSSTVKKILLAFHARAQSAFVPNGEAKAVS